MLAAFEPKTQSCQHRGQVTTLHAVETGKKFSNVDPLDGVLGEGNAREDTLKEEAFFNVPRTACVCMKMVEKYNIISFHC